jgi:hypothetical protein
MTGDQLTKLSLLPFDPKRNFQKANSVEISAKSSILKDAVSAAISSPDYSQKSARKKQVSSRYDSGIGRSISMGSRCNASGNKMRKQVIVRLFSAVLRSLLIISMLANLNACTNTVRRDSPPIPKFDSVAIVNKGTTDELKARFGVAPEDSSSEVDAGAGALAGAATGVRVAEEGCGPYFFLCALYTVPVGTMIGAIAGGLTDWAANSQKEPSNKQLLVVDKLFAEIAHQRTIHLEIENSLKRQIPPERLVDIAEADTLLQFRLYDVRFTIASSGKYALTLKTVMLIKWNRNGRQTASTNKTYEHTSRSLPMEDWVQDDGKTLNLAFDACIEGLTEKMIEDIQFEKL